MTLLQLVFIKAKRVHDVWLEILKKEANVGKRI